MLVNCRLNGLVTRLDLNYLQRIIQKNFKWSLHRRKYCWLQTWSEGKITKTRKPEDVTEEVSEREQCVHYPC